MITSTESARTVGGCGLPGPIAQRLQAAGLDVAGVLGIERYDELVGPAWQSAELLAGARSALLIGCGGRSLEPVLDREHASLDARHPVDEHTRVHTERAARDLTDGAHPTRAFFYWQSLPEPGRPDAQAGFADFLALAQAAGLGHPGRLRVLLHPEFGPWWSLRALLLTTLRLEPGAPRVSEDPCLDCAAPCVSACPGGALDSGPLDALRCFSTRERVSECETRCAARHACVMGPEHAYSPHWEAHFMRSTLRSARKLQGKPQLPG